MINHQISNGKIPDFVVEFLVQPDQFTKENELKKWLSENPCNLKLFYEYLDIWQGTIKAGSQYYNVGAAWNRVRNSIKISDIKKGMPQPVFNLSPVFYRIAAAVLLFFIILASGILLFRTFITQNFRLTNSEYNVPYGSRSQMVLPDGSKVWLNAGTKIKFNNRFGLNNRDLYLEGEAYFVVKPAKKSFHVITRVVSVEVKGTVFNIKAYADEDIVETTVEEGSVQLFLRNDKKHEKVMLYANQRAIYNIMKDKLSDNKVKEHVERETEKNALVLTDNNVIKNVIIDKKIEPEIYTSWKDEKWIVEREELQQLAKKLERRYNVKVFFKDESLRSYVFSGVLRDETLEQVLNYIKLTAPVGFEIKNNQVTLFENSILKSQLKQIKN